jgi:hypothetical protein
MQLAVSAIERHQTDRRFFGQHQGVLHQAPMANATSINPRTLRRFVPRTLRSVDQALQQRAVADHYDGTVTQKRRQERTSKARQQSPYHDNDDEDNSSSDETSLEESDSSEDYVPRRPIRIARQSTNRTAPRDTGEKSPLVSSVNNRRASQARDGIKRYPNRARTGGNSAITSMIEEEPNAEQKAELEEKRRKQRESWVEAKRLSRKRKADRPIEEANKRSRREGGKSSRAS